MNFIKKSHNYFNSISIIILFPLFVFLTGCSNLPVSEDPASGIVEGTAALMEVTTKRPEISQKREREIALKLAKKIRKEHEFWNDPLLEQYLTQITQRIARDARDTPWQYKIYVINDPRINAFTPGGGLIYLFAGLIARMETEAQLASVIAHEMAHITERHVVKGMQASFDRKMLATLAASATGQAGLLSGKALKAAYHYTTNAMVNGHGRSQEAEADEIGLKYLVNAGYAPRGMPNAFRKLLERHGDPSPVENFFYGDHPRLVSRIEGTTELIETRYANRARDENRLVNTEEFKRRTYELVVQSAKMDYKNGRTGTAKALFNKASHVDEKDPVPHYYLGKILLETSRKPDAVDQAIDKFEAALQRDTQFADAHRELGMAYYRKGAHEKAIKALETYLKMKPEAKDAERIRSSLKELKEY